MLAAAAELIAERGFSDTRIADVADPGRREPGARHLLLRHQGQPAHRGVALVRALVLRRGRGDAGRPPALATGSGTWSRGPAADAPRRADGDWGLWFDLWVQAFRHPEVKKDRAELDQQWRDLDRPGRAGRHRRRRDRGGRRRVVRDHVAALLDGLVVQVALDDPLVDSALARRIALGVALKDLGLS